MRAPSASGGRRSLRSGLRRLRCRTARGGRTVVSFIREGKDCGIVMVTRSTARVPKRPIGLAKAAIGIAWFDEITVGGLPHGRSSLVCGGTESRRVRECAGSVRRRA